MLIKVNKGQLTKIEITSLQGSSITSISNKLEHIQYLGVDFNDKISLIYPLQCAPLTQFSHNYLKNIDKIIRSTVKEILQLLDDTPNAMLYSPNKCQGLGVVRLECEASLQHFNICQRLQKVDDAHMHHLRQLQMEEEGFMPLLMNYRITPEVNDFAKDQDHFRIGVSFHIKAEV